MDTLNEAILSVVAICAVAAVLGSPVACTMHRNAKVAEAIKAGADPIEARCAMTDDVHDPVCMVRALTKK
jgi:hypothetical protein